MSPTAPALPAGSSLGHSYEYGLDVNIGSVLTPIWQPFRRISDYQPNVTPVVQDAATYDDFGSPNADKTGETWAVTFTALVNRITSTGLYPAEVQAVLDRTKPSAKGDLAVLHIRYYHKPEVGTPNPEDAYEGFATVAVSRANAGADGAVEKRTITLTGKGPRTEIVNPFAGWGAAAPTISAANPVGALTGELVTISGTGFTGTTTVTVAAVVSEFAVLGDSTLVVALEAGTAGAVDIIVTNATGPSTGFSYTRGA